MGRRTTKVELDVELSGMGAKMRNATGLIRDFGKEWVKLGRSSKMHEIEGGLQAVTVALGAVMVASVVAAAQYEQAVSKMRAATQATASQMESLRDATMAAGRGGVFTATEAAQAVTELGKASLTAQQIIDGGLKGALDLAAAGEMAVGDAAETAASAMSMFGLAAKDIPHIADLLAAGAGKAQGEVSDMAMALKQSGLVAAQTGLSIDETTGALAAMASAGLIGSDAGTSLKTMLTMLSGPTEKAAKLMQKLGIDAFDTSGEFVGLANFAGQLESQMADLSDEERQAALSTIFGADAIRAASVIYGQGSKGIQKWIDAVNDSGYAAEVAAIKNDNFIGDLKKLRGALEGALIGQGSGFTGALRDITQALTGVINGFASLPKPIQSTVSWLLIVTGVTTGLIFASAKMATSIAAARTTLLAMGAAGQIAAKALTGLGVAMGFVAKAAIVVGIVWGLKTAVDALADIDKGGPEALRFEVDELVRSLTDLGQTGAATGNFADAYGANLAGFGKTMGEYQKIIDDYNKGNTVEYFEGGEGLSYTDYKADDVAEANRKIVESSLDADSALAQMVQNGYAGAAARSFDTMKNSMLAAGVPLDTITAAFPQYGAAVLNAQQANTGVAQGFGSIASNADLMSMSMTDAMNTGQSLVDVFNALNGAATEFAGAEINAEDAIDAFTDAIKASGGSLDVTTEKGRAAKSALLDMTQAAADAANAKYLETGSISESMDVYDDYIEQLKAVMIAAGMDKDVVEDLIATYAKMPGEIFTRLDLNADGVIDAADRYIRTLQRIPEYKHTTLLVSEQWTRSKLGADFGDGGVVEFYASGGMREDHTAQILPAGAMRVWAEPETGGEAYIPLSPAKRQRSEQIWAEVGKRFGMNTGATVVQSAGTTINATIQAHSDRFSLGQVQSEFANWGVV